MADIEGMITGIDQGLAAGSMDATGDALRTIEDQVWADLNESAQAGWRTTEEAQDEFMTWRQTYRAIGKTANGGA